ncbi:MAG: hypothetical protein AUJ52_08020 [Elusimicrobia bacterium CG1_02_63_36]|nr:MAG: hypothetical protein AUJ52_08020 [Elusimicrobia bacterium CG1_02_63_36]
MNAITALASLSKLDVPCFTTNDASSVLHLSRSAASHMLARLARAGVLARLRPGLWSLPGRMDRMALAEALAAPMPAYISLQSALYHHGMISQIPSVLYAVTPGQTRRFDSPLGSASLHHISSRFFFGFERVGRHGPSIAVPEKALLDTLYFSPAKSGLFRSFPEIEFPKRFKKSLAREWVRRIPSLRTRTLVMRKLEALLRPENRS